MDPFDDPWEVARRATGILREGTTQKARFHANNAYGFAMDSLKEGQSDGAKAMAMHYASAELHSASTLHTAKLEAEGNTPSGDVMVTTMDPTALTESFVNKINEGLKNGR
jgi:hypothetical protein